MKELFYGGVIIMYTNENAIEDGKADYRHCKILESGITSDFLIGKKVKILTGKHTEETGIITIFYPKGMFANFTIYQIKINEHLSGQFTDDQFELLED